MRTIWCRDIEDLLSIARSQGWLFYYDQKGKHYYYLYAGSEKEILCLAIEAKEKLAGKYVTIDDEGKIVTSEKPIMPACSRIVGVAKDEEFEKLLQQLNSS
ncbi:MAG: hypothetical protein ACUVQM_01725 [Candidatus Hadarchaeaceae archaeon]